MRAIVLFAASGALAGGCSATDAGTGSGTLLAVVEIIGTAQSTTIEAQLQLRGAGVRGANVFVQEVDSGANATLESPAPGLYRTSLQGYARTLALRVTAGNDWLEATLEGPTPHVITRPPNDARVRRAGFDSLEVHWDADDLADKVEIRAGEVMISVEGDVYRANVPLASLANGEHTLQVTRETSVALAGGIGASRMRSRYKVDNRFTLE